ncbi:MAG TPA: abhydrolase domain-containing 18 [Blastocatellia bacterium]
MLKKSIHNWERRLARRDTRRAFEPFHWGVPFLEDLAVAGRVGIDGIQGNRRDDRDTSDSAARQFVLEFNHRAISESDRFFEARPVSGYSLDGDWLSFPSPIQTPYPENNIVCARYFRVPARAGKSNGLPQRETANACGRAVIVLPQWNADIEGHVTLCRLLNTVGIAALRLSLPYHDRRLPEGCERADYLVSPNVGRTLQGCLQAVLDCRAAIDWLVQRGYDRIGILGTSIGSCISFLTMAHDARLKVAVLNHVSSYFGDVVWEGLTTAHVRKGLEPTLNRSDVRNVWTAISPNSYANRLRSDSLRCLMISARYDLSFTPELSHLLFEECGRNGFKFQKRTMPCGHYSLGEPPFKYVAAALITSYLRRHL